jgi:hypothetical protein
MKSIERNSSLFILAGIAFVALGAVGCGSSLTPGTGSGGSTGTGGWGGDAGGPPTGGTTGSGGVAGSGTGGAAGAPTCTAPRSGEVPSEHRATAPACKPSNQPPVPDGGVPSCSTDADCTASASSLYRTCVHGTCAFDQCLTDTDCGSTAVCACSSDYYGGNSAYHPNLCVPANCRLDSDCGAGGYCSPSRGYCGTFQGFYCHTAVDSCVDPTVDCQSCGFNACTYSPAVGAFTCGSSVCAG